MGERLLCKQEVDGSIPFTSTTDRTTAGRSVAAAARRRRGSAALPACQLSALRACDREKPVFAGAGI